MLHHFGLAAFLPGMACTLHSRCLCPHGILVLNALLSVIAWCLYFHRLTVSEPFQVFLLLTLFCNFYLAVAPLPLQAAPGSTATRTDMTQTEHSLWFSVHHALLVLTFFLIFEWSFTRFFFFFWDWCSVDSPAVLSKAHQKVGGLVGCLGFFVCLTCCKC